MTICASCGKAIKNEYRLNGKVYGYNCYKVALAQYKLELQKLINDVYALEAELILQVYGNMTFKNSNAIEFQRSVLDFYKNTGKVTYKQLDAVKSKFTASSWTEYYLLKMDIMEDKSIANKVLDSFYKDQRENKKFNIDYWTENKTFIKAVKLVYNKLDTVYIYTDEDGFLFINDDYDEEYGDILLQTIRTA